MIKKYIQAELNLNNALNFDTVSWIEDGGLNRPGRILKDLIMSATIVLYGAYYESIFD